MAAEAAERHKLIRERDYFTDRLSEIALELKRVVTEADELKQEMERPEPPDLIRLNAIRRRRAYLKRRADDLKIERQTSMGERDKFIKELGATQEQ